METGLRNRVAIVAASSTGLGRAVAEALAAEGARLCLCSRHEGRIAAAAEAIRNRYQVPVFARAVDVTDSTAVEQFVSASAAEFGRIDICVTNAGGPPAKSFANTTVADWRAATELNLLSHIYFARPVLAHMQRAGWGRFLMISSLAVRHPIDGLVLSNTVRGAVPGLTRTLANEYGPYGVLVNNVCPGFTRTERLQELAQVKALAQGVEAGAAFRDWEDHTALRRLAEPAEFADVVVFLASERAAYITGQSILVDGGYYKGAI